MIKINISNLSCEGKTSIANGIKLKKGVDQTIDISDCSFSGNAEIGNELTINGKHVKHTIDVSDCSFSGNTEIGNGLVINGESAEHTIDVSNSSFSGDIKIGNELSHNNEKNYKNFDERKLENCANISDIIIDSKISDINIFVSKSSKLEAHFYGEAQIDGDVNFDVQVVHHKIQIILDLNGTCFGKNLKLDVTLPSKIFETISVATLSENIVLNKGVSANYLTVKTKSGDLEANAVIFDDISVTTKSGAVKLYVKAKKDIFADISTNSGNISVKFDNIGNINLSKTSMRRTVRKRIKRIGCFTADVDIFTRSGITKII